MPITIPTELFMVKRGEERLAFVTPHENNAAGNKRKESALAWTNGYQSKGIKNEGEIISNELLSGYTILQDISRWSTDNVVWRILDPRGFEFEISSGNMFEILRSTSVTKGLIGGSCIFGREGGRNLLLPEDSEACEKGMIFTKVKAEKSGKLSDMKIGNLVTLSNGEEYSYLGKYFLLEYKRTKAINELDMIFNFVISDSSYYFFKPVAESEFIFFQKSPKVYNISIGTTIDNPLQIINEYISSDNLSALGRDHGMYVVAACKDKQAEFNFEFVPEKVETVNTKKNNYDLEYSYLANGQYLLARRGYTSNAETFSQSTIEFRKNYFILKDYYKIDKNKTSWYAEGMIRENPQYILKQDINKVEIICLNIEGQLFKLKGAIY